MKLSDFDKVDALRDDRKHLMQICNDARDRCSLQISSENTNGYIDISPGEPSYEAIEGVAKRRLADIDEQLVALGVEPDDLNTDDI